MKKDETMWEAYPKTPEHFRQTVAQAVEMQMRQAQKSEADEAAAEVQMRQPQKSEADGGAAEIQMRQQQNAETQMGQSQKPEVQMKRMQDAEAQRKRMQKVRTETAEKEASADNQFVCFEKAGQGKTESKRNQLQKQERKFGRVSPKTRRKSIKLRYLLPAAALLAIGGAVVAANNNELMKYLTDWKHLTESEAEAVIQTDVKQETTELVGAEYAGQQTIDQEWSKPLLTVKEAYFDGTDLRFIAEVSDEGKKYELSMKDHVYINGEDAALSTPLYEVEEEPGTYFGGAEVRDMSYLAGQLENDSVEVKMTILAFPSYEGHPFYTWKDVQAYRQIYQTGEFTDEDGMQYYVIPWKDEITSYTPQVLTVELALPEGVTELSGYQEACVVSQSGEWIEEAEEEQSVSMAESQSFEDQEALPDSGIAGNAESGPGNHNDNAESISGNSSHVLCDLEGAEGILSIDAEVIQEKDQVYTGKLRRIDFPVDKMASLYQEGTTDEWVQGSEEYGSVHWQYQDKQIFASGGYDASYTNYEELGEETLSGTGGILSKLGIDGKLELKEEKEEQGKTCKTYRIRWLLNGIPAAMESQIFCSGLMVTQDDMLTDFQWSGSFEITEKEEVSLLPMDQVLEKLAGYLEEGMLDVPDSGQPVTEIALEYYVDMTNEGIVFRPVWNFQVPYLVSEEHHIFLNNDMYCYMDAVTGALIRDAYGW